MKRIELEIDERTGELKAHVQGVAGPSCEDILALVEELAGIASEAGRTPEYAQRAAAGQAARSGGRR